jgi:hypothetical protein
VEAEGLVEAEGFVAGFAVGLVGLGAVEDFEGLEDCAIKSSKWTIGFLERIDLRSVGSAMIIKLNSIDLMNSSNLWAQRNAKALKGPFAAIHGITIHVNIVVSPNPSLVRQYMHQHLARSICGRTWSDQVPRCKPRYACDIIRRLWAQNRSDIHSKWLSLALQLNPSATPLIRWHRNRRNTRCLNPPQPNKLSSSSLQAPESGCNPGQNGRRPLVPLPLIAVPLARKRYVHSLQ